MNLVSGRIEEIYEHQGILMGRINVRGVILKASLALLLEVQVGDVVLVESGVAISKIDLTTATEN